MQGAIARPMNGGASPVSIGVTLPPRPNCWKALRLSALQFLLVASAFAQSTTDSDLDLIPEDVMKSPNQATASGSETHRRIYVEDGLTVSAWRGNLAVPLPGLVEPGWMNRGDLDARVDQPLSDRLAATYSGRWNLLANYHPEFDARRDLRHDFREGYLTWTVAAQSYLDVGRVNPRNGVAMGFNPTDVFKTNAVVERVSADPRVLREDRLGALLVRGKRSPAPTL
jgi:hypothetical protein